jgi:hypothetical protein
MLAAISRANPGTGTRRSGMGVGANAVTAQPTAGANRSHMRTGMHAAVSNTRAGSDNRTGMATRSNPMVIDTRARADAADMRARPHAVAADMRTDADTQDFDMRTHGISRDGGQEGQRTNRGDENFHKDIQWGVLRKQTVPHKVPG